MSTEYDIESIKEDIKEILRLLKNAGFVSLSPARVFDISQRAKRDADKLKERLHGNKTARK